MADEKKNTGPEEAVVTEAPSPENPSGPSVPPAPEQEAEQGTIPGMEEKSDPTETVIDLTAARKAAKEQPAPEAGGEGPGGEGEKKPARRGRRPKAEQEAPSSGKPGAAGKAKRSRAAKKEKAPRKRRKLRKKRKPPAPRKTRGAEAAPRPALRLALPPRRSPSYSANRRAPGKRSRLYISTWGSFMRSRITRSVCVTMTRCAPWWKAPVRPREDGGYEIIAGHRRQKANELAGYTKMPCIVREMTDCASVPISCRWKRRFR